MNFGRFGGPYGGGGRGMMGGQMGGGGMMGGGFGRFQRPMGMNPIGGLLPTPGGGGRGPTPLLGANFRPSRPRGGGGNFRGGPRGGFRPSAPRQSSPNTSGPPSKQPRRDAPAEDKNKKDDNNKNTEKKEEKKSEVKAEEKKDVAKEVKKEDKKSDVKDNSKDSKDKKDVKKDEKSDRKSETKGESQRSSEASGKSSSASTPTNNRSAGRAGSTPSPLATSTPRPLMGDRPFSSSGGRGGPPWSDGRKRPHEDHRDNRRTSYGGQDAEVAVEKLNVDVTKVTLDDYNSDLNLKLDDDGYGASNLTEPAGFCFCWGGARASYGVCRGKICFEVYIREHLPTDFGDDHKEQDPHVLRVGWSSDASSFQLGEELDSFGYGGTGRFSHNCKFQIYGESYGKGDVILGMVDFTQRPPTISYAKNGRWLGVATQMRNWPVGKREKALFPHVLSKNCSFQVNYGQQSPRFPPPPGFTFIDDVPLSQRVRGMMGPATKADCEMIMIVGLPGTGKTTWGINMDKQHPEKRYNIIGTDTLIDKMKVMGLPRKRNYHGRWDVLIQKASNCLNHLFNLASRRARNYILDQTNVYPNARKRKLRNFTGFKRKCAVLVPTDADMATRTHKRTHEDGKFVPEDAVLEMKKNFTLPQDDDQFIDEIIWIELHREDAQGLIDMYNKEGHEKKPSKDGQKGFRADKRDGGGQGGGQGRGRESRDQGPGLGRGMNQGFGNREGYFGRGSRQTASPLLGRDGPNMGRSRDHSPGVGMGRGREPSPALSIGRGREPFGMGRGRDHMTSMGRGRDHSPSIGSGRDHSPSLGRGRDHSPSLGRSMDNDPSFGTGRDGPLLGRDGPGMGRGRDDPGMGRGRGLDQGRGRGWGRDDLHFDQRPGHRPDDGKPWQQRQAWGQRDQPGNRPGNRAWEQQEESGSDSLLPPWQQRQQQHQQSRQALLGSDTPPLKKPKTEPDVPGYDDQGQPQIGRGAPRPWENVRVKEEKQDDGFGNLGGRDRFGGPRGPPGSGPYDRFGERGGPSDHGMPPGGRGRGRGRGVPPGDGVKDEPFGRRPDREDRREDRDRPGADRFGDRGRGRGRDQDRFAGPGRDDHGRDRAPYGRRDNDRPGQPRDRFTDRENQYGRRDDPHKRDDPSSRRDDPYWRRDDPQARRDESYGRRDDPHSRRDDPHVKREDDPHARRDDPFLRKEDPYGRREDPYGRRDDPQARREDHYGRRDDPYGRRPSDAYGRPEDRRSDRAGIAGRDPPERMGREPPRADPQKPEDPYRRLLPDRDRAMGRPLDQYGGQEGYGHEAEKVDQYGAARPELSRYGTQIEPPGGRREEYGEYDQYTSAPPRGPYENYAASTRPDDPYRRGLPELKDEYGRPPGGSQLYDYGQGEGDRGENRAHEAEERRGGYIRPDSYDKSVPERGVTDPYGALEGRRSWERDAKVAGGEAAWVGQEADQWPGQEDPAAQTVKEETEEQPGWHYGPAGWRWGYSNEGPAAETKEEPKVTTQPETAWTSAGYGQVDAYGQQSQAPTTRYDAYGQPDVAGAHLAEQAWARGRELTDAAKKKSRWGEEVDGATPAAVPTSGPDISNLLQQAGKFGLLPNTSAPPPPPPAPRAPEAYEQAAYGAPYEQYYATAPKSEPPKARTSRFGPPKDSTAGHVPGAPAGKPVDILAAQKEALAELGYASAGDGLLGATPGGMPAAQVAAPPPTLLGPLPAGLAPPMGMAQFAPQPGMLVGRMPLGAPRFATGPPRMYRPPRY